MTTLLLATLHCGSDVLVGIDRTREANQGEAEAGAAGLGPDLTTLRTVRRLPSGTHVAGGWTGCSASTDASCDGWMATTPGMLLEEARVAGPGADLVRSITLLGDDRVVAGLRTPTGVPGAWLARKTTTSFVWETSLSSDPTKPSDARAVDVAPDGTLIVGGNELLGPFESGWVARVSTDGTVLQRVRLGGSPSSSETTVETIASLVANGKHYVYVGGQRRQTVDGVVRNVPIVVELDVDLALFNSASGIHIAEAPTGTVRSILTDRERELTACAQLDDGVGVSRMRDYLSDVDVTRVVSEPGVRIVFGGCAAVEDGSIVLVGTVEQADGPHPWAGKIDRVSLEPRWTRIYENESGRLEAVAPATGGSALAVGSSGTRGYFLPIAP